MRKRQLSSKKKKVLIIFDNLDRCEPKYAYETLSAIKTFMDKKNCFYIIPCDDIAIKKYISASYNVVKNDNKFAQIIGDEFFDKLLLKQYDENVKQLKLEKLERITCRFVMPEQVEEYAKVRAKEEMI